jgi:AraC family transcriptional regulator of adaptative response / DNA-3-methyladenine glycosylase II
LGELGIVRQRQAAIIALAQAVADERLCLQGGGDVHATIAALKDLPGIGDWTAQYIAMRALRWPDAFPCGDVALQKALGVQGAKNPAREAQAASQAWRPWRSYAVISAWASLPDTLTKRSSPGTPATDIASHKTPARAKR